MTLDSDGRLYGVAPLGPVRTLFDYLEGAARPEDFLDGFPTVPRALALEALEEAKELLLARG